MKKVFLVLLLFLLIGCSETTKYIDETLPGDMPELFAEEWISTTSTSEFAGTFSPDFKYYFFTRREGGLNNRLYFTELVDNKWQEPKLSPISEDLPEFEPFISSDYELYFGSMRDNNSSLVIFKSTYQNEWSQPVFLDNGINDDFTMYISVADNKNIYFTSLQGISLLPYENGKYSSPIFTGIEGAHSFISKDESFILFDNSSYTDEPTKLYIAYKQEDYTFSKPIELDETINHPDYSQICASISPDGKYLFFSRFQNSMADIYWVNASVLDKYKK